jgi:hypothetical protein
VNGATPAPASASSVLCILGTNAGILKVSSDEIISWISAPPEDPTSPISSSNNKHAAKTRPQLPREIFDQDFAQGNGIGNVVFAAGRQARLWRMDLRTESRGWSFTETKSSVTKVRCVGEHSVLTSGLRSSMVLHDTRHLSKPILTFPDHRNEAHVHTGFDVSPALGVVAAGQDDGTVALFSMRSGRKLRSRALDQVKCDTPLRALMFSAMPWERWDSLWLGEGPALRKFSFGAKEMDDEA